MTNTMTIQEIETYITTVFSKSNMLKTDYIAYSNDKGHVDFYDINLEFIKHLPNHSLNQYNGARDAMHLKSLRGESNVLSYVGLITWNAIAEKHELVKFSLIYNS